MNNMFHNRKGQNQMLSIIMLILAFSIIFIIWFFYYNFLFSVGDEQVITPLNNITLNVANQTNVSAAMITHLESLPGKYRETDLLGDFYFIIFFGSFFLFTIISSLRAARNGAFSFFGTLFVGLIIFLLAAGYFITAVDWLFENLVVNVAQVDISETVLMEAYLNNIMIINFIWALFLIMLNQFKFKRIKKEEGRVEA